MRDKVLHAIIHETMTGERTEPRELRCSNNYPEMTGTIASTCMSRMEMRLVHDFEQSRVKSLKAFAQ